MSNLTLTGLRVSHVYGMYVQRGTSLDEFGYDRLVADVAADEAESRKAAAADPLCRTTLDPSRGISAGWNHNHDTDVRAAYDALVASLG